MFYSTIDHAEAQIASGATVFASFAEGWREIERVASFQPATRRPWHRPDTWIIQFKDDPGQSYGMRPTEQTWVIENTSAANTERE